MFRRVLTHVGCVFFVGYFACIALDANANSLRSIDNAPNQYEVGVLKDFPANFAAGEFTYEMWVKPITSFNGASYGVGTCGAGGNSRLNWCSENVARYSDPCWWCNGNFLVDGVAGGAGTFALQFYGGGRIRWLHSDTDTSTAANGFWGIGPGNANNPTIVDNQWHHIATVRRFVNTNQSQLELWVDGVLIDTQTTNARTNFAQLYSEASFSSYPYVGWFFLAEKQAVNIADFALEDHKGLIDELRFWNRAKTANELTNNWRNPVNGTESGLSGWYDFSDVAYNASGTTSSTQSCNRIARPAGAPVTAGPECMELRNRKASLVSTESAPTQPLAAAGPLDIDASNATTRYDAATDGVLLIRYLLGFRDQALIAGARGASATRDAAQIAVHLQTLLNDSARPLDVDNDGVVRAHTDGVLIARYLRNARGSALTAGIANAAQATAIEGRIAALAP
jgi:Concanavalin A-like lectin/glucanases superfamily